METLRLRVAQSSYAFKTSENWIPPARLHLFGECKIDYWTSFLIDFISFPNRLGVSLDVWRHRGHLGKTDKQNAPGQQSGVFDQLSVCQAVQPITRSIKWCGSQTKENIAFALQTNTEREMKPTNKQTKRHTMWLIKRLFPQPSTRITQPHSKTPGLYEGEKKKRSCGMRQKTLPHF